MGRKSEHSRSGAVQCGRLKCKMEKLYEKKNSLYLLLLK